MEAMHAQRAGPVLLDDRLFAGPAEVMNARRHLEEAPGGQRLALRRIQRVPSPMLKVPEITVTVTLIGCQCAGIR